MKKEIKNYYFVIIPILITILVYSVSLTYDFRNFDENIVIKNVYVKKTIGEYFEKYLLVNVKGTSEAFGFSFSSIKNTHVTIFGWPLFYITGFLFQVKPYIYHLWGLLLHCLALCFFILFTFRLTQSKLISLFAGLAWTLHPTNVESIIWATNWLQSFGAALYFFTLYKMIDLLQNNIKMKFVMLFTLFMTTIGILFTEHTITIPIVIFLTVFFHIKNSFKTALTVSFPSFITIAGYWLFRSILISGATKTAVQNSLGDLIERVIFLTPQIFVHELKLIFYPLNLTIDQLDLLNLDKNFFGTYHLFCIFILILFFILIWRLKNKFPFLSYGLLVYIVTILPFLQIIPLYSLAAERYNYLGSAFISLGITASLYKIFNKSNKYFFPVLIILCLLLGTRTISRIQDWKDSKSLFLSAANTSKTLLKKGIWTYNIAICESEQNKKEELLNLSTNLLKLFIQNAEDIHENKILKKYELDKKSLLAKAALRIATNYEILNYSDLQLKYLSEALNYSQPDTQVQSLIFKNLGTYHFQKNDILKALDYYTKSNVISPNPTIDYAIAICYLKLNDFSNYEIYLQKAASVISTDNVAPLKTYGQFLELSKHDYQNAIKYYKIASLMENNPEPYILLTSLYLRLNQIDNAFKYVKRGLYGFPENPALTYFHGVIKINKGKLNDGIKDLISAVEKQDAPNDIKLEACNILVNIFLKQNNINSALKYNSIALLIDPKNPETIRNKELLMVR